MDPEDVEELCGELAERCGRALPKNGKSPLFIAPTVSGVIEFLCGLPENASDPEKKKRDAEWLNE